ncbi:MAG: hypothetical protein QOC61_989 [Acidobacteriota bacterium]|jgi:hypothetical protein|nr:hypothetical protein [Acidobacteriota bacterium]
MDGQDEQDKRIFDLRFSICESQVFKSKIKNPKSKILSILSIHVNFL